MDGLDELAIFVRIVDEDSLVRAARRLRRSPPAVTARWRRSRPASAGAWSTARRDGWRQARRGGRSTTRRRRCSATTRRRRSACATRRSAACSGSPRRCSSAAGTWRRSWRSSSTPSAARGGRAVAQRPQCRSHRRGDRRRRAHRMAGQFGALRALVGEVRRLWVASPGLSRATRPAADAGGSGRSRCRARARRAARPSGHSRIASRRAGAIDRPAGRPTMYEVAHSVRRAKVAASRNSCRTRWPTISLPANSCGCWRPTSSRQFPCGFVTKGRANRAAKVDAFLDFATKRLLTLPVLRAD